jgi:hypothetical protein
LLHDAKLKLGVGIQIYELFQKWLNSWFNLNRHSIFFDFFSEVLDFSSNYFVELLGNFISQFSFIDCLFFLIRVWIFEEISILSDVLQFILCVLQLLLAISIELTCFLQLRCSSCKFLMDFLILSF